MYGRTNTTSRGAGGDNPELMTITFTVEGAMEDNISILNSTGEIVANVIFPTGQSSAQITLDIQDGDIYKFRSHMNNAPFSMEYFEKDVILNSNTTHVKVMIGDGVYWGGNECTDFTGGIITSSEYGEVTKNTNSMHVACSDSQDTASSCYASFWTHDKIDATNAVGVGVSTSQGNWIESYIGEDYRAICGWSDNNTGAAMTSASMWIRPNDQNAYVWPSPRIPTQCIPYVQEIDGSHYIGCNLASRGKDFNVHHVWVEYQRPVPSSYETASLVVDGAQSDGITIYDREWNVVGYVNFVQGQTQANSTIYIREGGELLTFASTRGSYAKKVFVTSDTTHVAVMPDGALWWYNNPCAWNSGGWSAAAHSYTVGSTTYQGVVPTLYPNYDGYTTIRIYDRGNKMGVYQSNDSIDFASKNTIKFKFISSGLCWLYVTQKQPSSIASSSDGATSGNAAAGIVTCNRTSSWTDDMYVGLNLVISSGGSTLVTNDVLLEAIWSE